LKGLVAHTLPTVITAKHRPLALRLKPQLFRRFKPAADSRQRARRCWACRDDRHEDRLWWWRESEGCPSRRSMTPFETGTQEDQGIIGRRLSPTAGWPALPTCGPEHRMAVDTTGIGDLDDLGNQCSAGQSCSDNFQSRSSDLDFVRRTLRMRESRRRHVAQG